MSGIVCAFLVLFELLLGGVDIVAMSMRALIPQQDVLCATAVLVPVCSQPPEMFAACMNIFGDRCTVDFSHFQVGIEPCSSVVPKGFFCICMTISALLCIGGPCGKLMTAFDHPSLWLEYRSYLHVSTCTSSVQFWCCFEKEKGSISFQALCYMLQ